MPKQEQAGQMKIPREDAAREYHDVLGAAHVAAWKAALPGDAELAALSAHATVSFGFAVAGAGPAIDVAFSNGALTATAPELVVTASSGAWATFFSPLPPPGYQTVLGMLRSAESAVLAGSEKRFIQHAHLVRRVLEIGREVLLEEQRTPRPTHQYSRVGKAHLEAGYVTIEVDGVPLDIFHVASGQGRPVLLLHTAGADSRQYDDLLADRRFTDDYRLIAVDLPGHGRSDYPATPHGSYSLRTAWFAEVIEKVTDALDLRDAIVSGASMSGAICLELAYRVSTAESRAGGPAQRVSGVVAFEAVDYVPGSNSPWLKHPEINQSLVVPEWILEFMAPHSDPKYRRRVWWQYSQGGYGVFAGDLEFYRGDWDARGRTRSIDTSRCGVVMMTGEYDSSCTPEMSRATAARIVGAHFEPMQKIGHFPMAENPPLFAEYFLRALARPEVAARP